jgi:hypothetical protein
MPKWDALGWIAYTGLWIAALMLAVDTGLRAYPELSKRMPAFLTGELWGFLPFALLTVSGVIFLARSLGWI